MAPPHAGAGSHQSRSVRRFYQLTAWIYDLIRSWWSKCIAEAEEQLDLLFAESVHSGCRVLELGPGTGVNLARLYRVAPQFQSYLGIDLSKEMLFRARKIAQGDGRVELILSDVSDISSVESRFDFIVSTWMLSHLENPEATVRAALEKLAPGGAAVFLFGTAPPSGPACAIYRAIWRAGSARLVDPEPLRRLSGFERSETFDAALGAMATLIVYRAALFSREG